MTLLVGSFIASGETSSGNKVRVSDLRRFMSPVESRSDRHYLESFVDLLARVPGEGSIDLIEVAEALSSATKLLDIDDVLKMKRGRYEDAKGRYVCTVQPLLTSTVKSVQIMTVPKTAIRHRPRYLPLFISILLHTANMPVSSLRPQHTRSDR